MLGGVVAAALWLGTTPATAEWRVYEARHFQIYSESGEAKASELAARLERYDKLMRMATGIPDDNPAKVRVFEVASTDDIERALGVTDSGIAGFYSSNSFGPFLLTPRRIEYGGDRYFTPLLVLQHEYAHHFMLQYFPATYPSWYVEGFAELIGSSAMEKDGRILYGAPAKQRGNELTTYWIPLQELLVKDEVKDFDNYGQGWAITQYLTMDPARAKQLRTYLALLNAGKSNKDAATQAFGDLARLNADIRGHVQSGSWTVRPVKPEIALPVLTGSRALRPAEVALLPEMVAFDDDPLSAIKDNGEREKQAKRRRALLARIKDKAATFPNDPHALALLAEAAAVIDDKAEVDRVTRQALAIDPGNVKALVRRSLFLSDQAKGLAGPARTAKAAEARALAVQANRADPDDALPLFAFYQSFNLVGQPPSPAAITGLESAVATLPDIDEMRLVLVEEYARAKRWRAAMTALAPLANSPHDSPQRKSARERMAQLVAAAGGGASARSPAT
ncbi:hypothetical protein [Sphingomonas humi]